MKSQDSNQYYDHHALRLREVWKSHKSKADLSPFLQSIERNGRILDLGCGTAQDLSWFVELGFRGVGLDASAEMVRLAREQFPGLEIQHKNFLLLSLEPESYDAVWANESWVHQTPEEIQRVAAVCFKGLKPGGVLGVTLFEGSGTFEDREGDLTGPARSIHLFTEKQISTLLEQTGFQILRVGRKPPETSSGFYKMLILAKRV